MTFNEHSAGIDLAVETITDWLTGNENPLTWNPPRYAGLWRWCLGWNLAVAGGLCAAHGIGLNEAEGHRLYHQFGYRSVECWSPGCGKAAP